MSHTAQEKFIVMLGIHPASKEKGGISTVIDIYRAAGLFARWPIRYIGTMASGSHAHKLRVGAAALGEYVRVLFSGRVALVHAHTASRASFWRKSIFILLARAVRVPVVLHLHGAEFEQFYRNESSKLGQWFIRFVLRGADRVVVLSSQWKALIEGIAPGANVTTIVNPVPMREGNDVSIPRERGTLLFLGRFGARKGIFDLLQAMQKVAVRCPEVKLRCGGDGDIEGVRTRASELGLADRVEILGWVSGAAKDAELARAAIYVLPSYAEGLPMGVLEAMAAGTPIVATPVGGVPDAITDGVEGYLVEPGDVDALADRIVRLLEDASLRVQFAERARAKAFQTFGTAAVLAKVEQLYAGLGAQPRTSTRGDEHDASEPERRVVRSA